MVWRGLRADDGQSRLHGSNSYRVHWNYGEDAVKVTAKMVQAKLRLMPYLYAQVGSTLVKSP